MSSIWDIYDRFTVKICCLSSEFPLSVALALEVEQVAVELTGMAIVAADHGFRRFLKIRNPVLSTILSALHGVTQ